MSQKNNQQLLIMMIIESFNRMCDVALNYNLLDQNQEYKLDDSLIEKMHNRYTKLVERAEKTNTAKQKILFLAADPQNRTRLRLMQEFREIKHNLQMSTSRDTIHLCIPELSVRKQDLNRRLLQEKPSIVHFAGHGVSDGSLCFEREDGACQEIKPGDLDLLFELHADYVKCVILNACYSSKQAKAISKHIDFVIGMSVAIGDQAAIDFSIGFYQALGEGKGIEDAYKYGCALIASSEKKTPILLRR